MTLVAKSHFADLYINHDDHEMQTAYDENFGDDELVASSTMSRMSDTWYCRSTDRPLLRDCMWSAVLLPPGLQALRSMLQSSSDGDDSTQWSSSSSDASLVDDESDDMMMCAVVDPSLVSPCPQVPVSVNCDGVHPQSDTPTVITSNDVNVETPVDCVISDRDVDSESNDDDVDVDVVSLRRPSASVCRHQTASGVRHLLGLPPARSVQARVAAMHNYSSDRPRSQGRRDIYSAPPSPVLTSRDMTMHCSCSSKSLSTPSSPSPDDVDGGVREARARRRGRTTRHRDVAAWTDDIEDVTIYGGTGRRALHNVLERRRRDHLKCNFDALQAAVPGTSGSTRVPKVTILRRARDYLRQLTATSYRLAAEHTRLLCLHRRWRYRLAMLTDGKVDVWAAV